MDAIKKKMQSMKLEKETAFDRADQLEQRLVEHKYIYDKVYTTATDSSLKPRLHLQPVVNRLSIRFSNPFNNRFDNRLYRVYSRLSNRL